MAREFESSLLMEYRGLSRKPGSFTDDKGEVVHYSEALRFEYDEDGVTRHQDFPLRDFDDIADFDVKALQKGDIVQMTRVLVAYENKDGKGWFETVKDAQRQANRQPKKNRPTAVAA